MKRIYITLVLVACCYVAAYAQDTKQLYVLQTSDTHSRIEPISPQTADRYAGMGGTVRRSSFIKEARKENPDLLLFDCGDISQGTPYYNMFRGEVEIKMMNIMKYDAMALGNHEFDFGMDNMVRLFSMAQFPVLCANYDVTGTPLEGLVKPYTIIQRNGLKVGVFGLAPRTEGLVQADKCEGVVYLNPIDAAQEVANKLKASEGCDVVICLSHLGYLNEDAPCDVELVQKTNNIDVILGGHSHTFMKEPAIYLNKDGKDVPILHTGKSGIYVGAMKIILAKEE